ncbi:MAG: hypothetical protein QOJ88_1029 [Pyrinomonadaceae bacterium]|jgi:hypothetical protein|nr:hypothetical protein [Pyrinomonadaceae bacterium]
MNSKRTQPLEREIQVASATAVSNSYSDPLNRLEDSQSALGNAAVAEAAKNTNTAGRSGLRSAMQPGFGALELQLKVGNSGVQRALRAASIQPKLAVGQPDDLYEQEADHVAQMVMRMPSPSAPTEASASVLERKCAASETAHEQCSKSAEGQGRVQRKPLFSRITSFIQRHASASEGSGESELRQPVESQIKKTRGGGEPLSANARSFFEPRFGMDFSEVRVHTGNDANEMNRAVGARAFTHGSDIYFGAGNSPADLELTAHELTHVVQQTGEGASPSDAEPAVQRVPIATNGGSFDTPSGYYGINAPTGAIGQRLGANIWLEFMANDLVESTKIGLIQSVKAMKSSAPAGSRDTVATGVGDTEEGQLIMGPGQADPGREIDQAVHPGGRAVPSTSPVYGVGYSAGGGETTLSQGAPSVANSQWGSHTKDPITGAFLAAVPARIADGPGRTIEFVGQNFEHTFEVAALAIEGPIPVNTYLGSVSWGYTSDAAGHVTVAPLALVGAGTPSAGFMGAAERWNAATFQNAPGAALPSVDIPITNLTSTLVSTRTTSDLVIQIARITAELIPMAPGTDRANKEFEKRAMEAELARRADQPTRSLADQEASAALLSTADLIRRSDALPAEIRAMPASPPRTDKELEQEGVKREIAKRRMLITVHVHETEDIIGSDSVYVTAVSGFLSNRTSVVNLNNGEEHAFVVPLSALFVAPLTMGSTSLVIRAYDEDWEGDDKMFEKDWIWSNLPAEETQSRDGGRYTVRIDFVQLR